MLTIVYNFPKALLWECDWIEYLFKDIPHKTVENLDHSLVFNNSIVVYPHFHRSNCDDYLKKLDSMNMRYGLIHLSDELQTPNLLPECQIVYLKSGFVLRNYFRESMADNVLHFPLGYISGFANISTIKDITKRTYCWTMISARWDENRQKMADALNIVPNGRLHIASEEGGSLSPGRMSRIYRDSIFIPCPAGNFTIDTFRVTEALEAGSIPLVEKNEYWIKSYGPDFPGIQVDSWDDAAILMIHLAADEDALRRHYEESQAWWVNRKNKTIESIKSLVLKTFN